MNANLKMLTNMDAIADMVGSLRGISDGVEDNDYMEEIIKEAHGKSEKAFNLAAVATASTGHLQHVFEYGVPGVTRGAPRYPDPTSQEARLWINRLEGKGGMQNIGFTFRPAFNRNPTPRTTAYTGVASKYLRKLSRRKYIFWNRAFVTESGQSVEIHAKRGDYLFVPFDNKPVRNPKYAEKKFVMWNTKRQGPIINTPGDTTKGTFTAFWLKWWSGAGSDLMQTHMTKKVERDIALAISKAAKRANANKVEPAQMADAKATAAAAQAEARKLFEKDTKVMMDNEEVKS